MERACAYDGDSLPEDLSVFQIPWTEVEKDAALLSVVCPF